MQDRSCSPPGEAGGAVPRGTCKGLCDCCKLALMGESCLGLHIDTSLTMATWSWVKGEDNGGDQLTISSTRLHRHCASVATSRCTSFTITWCDLPRFAVVNRAPNRSLSWLYGTLVRSKVLAYGSVWNFCVHGSFDLQRCVQPFATNETKTIKVIQQSHDIARYSSNSAQLHPCSGP